MNNKMEFLAGNEKRFADFISNLNERDKIAILSHNDRDGICSAVIVSKSIGNPDYVGIIPLDLFNLPEIISELKKKKINKIIICDLAIFDSKELLKKLEEFAELLVIDHHPFMEDLNSERITYLKADTHYPAAYICYYLFSKIKEIPEIFGVLGTLCDTDYKYNENNAETIYDDYGFKSKKQNLWEIARNLTYAIIYFKDSNPKKVYDILMGDNYLENLKKLEKYSKIILDEIESHTKDFEKNHDEYKDLILYLYKPKFSFASILSTIISLRDFSKTIILAYEKEGRIRMSCRRQDGKVDCNRLMRLSVEGIPDSKAGGHFKASGGDIPKESFEKFKENLFRVYDSLKDNLK